MLNMLILGLDGATLDIINPLIEQGRLPNLARLQQEGAWGPLRSTLPPVTAAAWSTFMTGLNPGKHGIFQWRTYDPTTYTNLNEKVVTAERLAGRTFWDMLGKAHHRVGIITVPVTYPTWEVNGYLLSGYPCPDAENNYTYPPQWGKQLSKSYNFSVDHYLNASDEKIYVDGLDMLERRTDLAIDLARKNMIDVCVMVLGEIDRAQHDFFKYAESRFSASQTASDDFREAINRHYEVSDAQLGRLLDEMSPDGVTLVVSDHGGGPHPPRFFNTNAWLRSNGWLAANEQKSGNSSSRMKDGIQWFRKWFPFEETLRKLLPAGLINRARSYTLNIADIDWPNTKAYRFPMYFPAEAIEINLQGRQPEGCVRPGEDYDQLVQEIVSKLRNARDLKTGEAIVEAVYTRDELYSGPYFDIAPDIVFICHPSHRTGTGLHSDYTTDVDLDALLKDNGVHTMDGILFAYGKNIAKGKYIENANLIDIAPTALHLADLPVPSEMDGKVLKDILTDEQARQPVSYVESDYWEAVDVTLSEEDEADMLDKLRGLGYVD